MKDASTEEEEKSPSILQPDHTYPVLAVPIGTTRMKKIHYQNDQNIEETIFIMSQNENILRIEEPSKILVVPANTRRKISLRVTAPETEGFSAVMLLIGKDHESPPKYVLRFLFDFYNNN